MQTFNITLSYDGPYYLTKEIEANSHEAALAAIKSQWENGAINTWDFQEGEGHHSLRVTNITVTDEDDTDQEVEGAKYPIVDDGGLMVIDGGLFDQLAKMVLEGKQASPEIKSEIAKILSVHELDLKQRMKATAHNYWQMLGDIPTDEDGPDGTIEQQFMHFPKGTPVYDIWHWLEAQFDVSVAEDLIPA